MNRELSKREKFLVFFAGIALLAFISARFFIMPAYANYSAKLEEKEFLSSEKMLLEMKLDSEESYVESRENAYKIYRDIMNRYPDQMPNEDIDRILTGICVTNQLNPITLGISDASKSNSAFLTITASMTVRGSYDSLRNLTEEVNKTDYIRITRTSFSSKNIDSDDLTVISLAFEITMVNRDVREE